MKLVCQVVLLLLSISSGINASNKITIATIGNIPETKFERSDPNKTVENVISFWERKIEQVLPYKPDLILLPEMCDRPKGFNANEIELFFKTRGDKILKYFTKVAKKNNCYLVFNSRDDVEGGYANTTFLIDREGKLMGKYKKNFSTINEMKKNIIPSTESPVFHCDFGKITVATCFDLNFDELRLRHVAAKPDIVLFSSKYHDGLVQNYWAYSIEAYFVSALGFREIPSEILNPLVEVIISSTNYFDFAIKEINLGYELVHLDHKMKEKSLCMI